MLARVARRSRRTQSQVARDALRRQLAIELFDRLRERVLPFAESRGLVAAFATRGLCADVFRLTLAAHELALGPASE